MEYLKAGAAWQGLDLNSLINSLDPKALRVSVYIAFYSGRKALTGGWGILWACVHTAYFLGKKNHWLYPSQTLNVGFVSITKIS